MLFVFEWFSFHCTFIFRYLWRSFTFDWNYSHSSIRQFEQSEIIVRRRRWVTLLITLISPSFGRLFLFRLLMCIIKLPKFMWYITNQSNNWHINIGRLFLFSTQRTPTKNGKRLLQKQKTTWLFITDTIYLPLFNYSLNLPIDN